jgi:hypothetical protein
MYLKTQLRLTLSCLTILSSLGVEAALIDRGNGMIYDEVLNITWLQDANYAQTQYETNSGEPGLEGDADGRMTWNAAQSWADNLIYNGYDDWRLPSISSIIPGTSELAHLWTVTLGNSSLLTLADPFSHLQSSQYWLGTGGSFDASNGSESPLAPSDTSLEFYAWAVRDGDIDPDHVPVTPEPISTPIPAALWLFGSALVGLKAVNRHRHKTALENHVLDF